MFPTPASGSLEADISNPQLPDLSAAGGGAGLADLWIQPVGLGWHLKRGGHLFVDRRHPDRAGILKRWRQLVAEGVSLIIFAEGTRSWDGHVAPFKAGSFLLAIQAGLPIVPLAVIGTRQVMPKGRLRTEPADVQLVVYDPIEPPVIADPTAQDAKALADRVHAVVSSSVEARQCT